MFRVAEEKRFIIQYAILTLCLALPLLYAFVKIRNFYPVATSTMMMGGRLEGSKSYYILRGETVAGETVSVNPTGFTNALFMRTWGLVAATARNQSFKLGTATHPANLAVIEEFGGIENVPDGMRVPELIRAWGEMYNEALPTDSPARLKSIRLEAYKWNGGEYSAYDTYLKSWTAEL